MKKTHQQICEGCIDSQGMSFFDKDYEFDPTAFEGCNTASEFPERYLLKRCPCIKWRGDKMQTLNIREQNKVQYPEIKDVLDIPPHCEYQLEHLVLCGAIKDRDFFE
jgi:hypothetical protein